MPYFMWRGVDIQASIHKGYAYAESIPHLDEFLFKKNIALLSAQKKAVPFLHKKVSVSLKVQWVRQLALLLQSGVPILRALHIVRAQMATVLYDTTTAVIKEVERGLPLYQALQSVQFDPFVVAMARAGGEAGNLAHSLSAAADHIEKKDIFLRKIRTAALVPAMTLAVFFVVMGVIFHVIIPKFASLYASMHKELPWFTRLLLRFNNAVVDTHGGMYAGIVFCVAVAVFFIKYSDSYKNLYYRLPLLGELGRRACVLEYMSMCALLIRQGVPLVPALKIAQQGVVYEDWRNVTETIIERVEAGTLLSAACARYGEKYIESDCNAFIAVGEESGALPYMLAQVVSVMQTRFDHKLTLITTLFQPVLIIVLGFFVMLLLMASYMPIFTMSYIM